MSDYSIYVPASTRRRFVAFVVNLTLWSLVGATFSLPALEVFTDLAVPLTAVILLIFSVLTESPGKRIFDLTVLDDQKRPVGVKVRFFRNMPLLVVYSLIALMPLFTNAGKGGKTVIGLLALFGILIFLSDGLVVLFTPDGRSLMDLRLQTRVYAPRSHPGLGSPRIFGIRVW